MTKNSEHKLKYLKNEKKNHLKRTILQELSVARNYPRPKSVPLISLPSRTYLSLTLIKELYLHRDGLQSAFFCLKPCCVLY